MLQSQLNESIQINGCSNTILGIINTLCFSNIKKPTGLELNSFLALHHKISWNRTDIPAINSDMICIRIPHLFQTKQKDWRISDIDSINYKMLHAFFATLRSKFLNFFVYLCIRQPRIIFQNILELSELFVSVNILSLNVFILMI